MIVVETTALITRPRTAARCGGIWPQPDEIVAEEDGLEKAHETQTGRGMEWVGVRAGARRAAVAKCKSCQTNPFSAMGPEIGGGTSGLGQRRVGRGIGKSFQRRSRPIKANQGGRGRLICGAYPAACALPPLEASQPLDRLEASPRRSIRRTQAPMGDVCSTATGQNRTGKSLRLSGIKPSKGESRLIGDGGLETKKWMRNLQSKSDPIRPNPALENSFRAEDCSTAQRARPRVANFDRQDP